MLHDPAPGYIDNYYSRTLSNDVPYPALQGKVEVDVCVIGAGLAGLATALGLVERGKSVVLLESSRIGYGASGRSGGFVLKDYALQLDGLVAKVGVEKARALFAFLTKAQNLISRRIQDYSIDCGPNTNGYLNVSWLNQPDVVKRYAAFMQDTVGEPVEVWSRDKIRDLYRTNHYYDALYYPHDFQIHPLRYCRGLAKVIAEKGGQVFEFSQALSLRRTTDGYETKTPTGLVKSEQVVLCGSAYGGGLHPKIKYSVLPVSTYIMVTEPIDPVLLEASVPSPYMMMDMRYASNYYRRLPDGRLLWGGYVSLRDNPPGLREKMERDLHAIYPQLKGVKSAVTWSGKMGFSTHKMPYVRPIQPGLWVCTAFGGHGLVPTTAGGEIVAAAIAAGDKGHELFEPFGMGFTGGYLGRIAAQGLYGWWRFKDYIG